MDQEIILAMKPVYILLYAHKAKQRQRRVQQTFVPSLLVTERQTSWQRQCRQVIQIRGMQTWAVSYYVNSDQHCKRTPETTRLRKLILCQLLFIMMTLLLDVRLLGRAPYHSKVQALGNRVTFIIIAYWQSDLGCLWITILMVCNCTAAFATILCNSYWLLYYSV